MCLHTHLLPETHTLMYALLPNVSTYMNIYITYTYTRNIHIYINTYKHTHSALSPGKPHPFSAGEQDTATAQGSQDRHIDDVYLRMVPTAAVFVRLPAVFTLFPFSL